MEHYDKEKLGFAVNETKAMLDWLNEKRDRFHELSEYWRTYGDTVGYTDDSDEMATVPVEFLEDIYTEQYDCLVFERECKKICKFLLNSNHKITAKRDDCLTFNILCSDETDASEFLKKIEMFINGSEDLVEEICKKENDNGR